MKSQGFEEVDHTGDLAICVWGEDFKSILIQAAIGLYHLLNIATEQDSTIKDAFSVEGSSKENMLVDFLNELLYHCEDRKQSYHTFSFIEKETQLVVNAVGEKVVSVGRSIKAVTFHDLDIRQTENKLETTITFDV